LQQQLETERKLAAKMRAVSDKQFAEPSHLEEFFLECVEKVRNDISDRKRLGREVDQKLRKGERGAEKARAKAAQGGDLAAFAAPAVALDDFTAADRRQVVELLLSSEPVLQFLYDKLFPVAGNSIGQLTDAPEF